MTERLGHVKSPSPPYLPSLYIIEMKTKQETEEIIKSRAVKIMLLFFQIVLFKCFLVASKWLLTVPRWFNAHVNLTTPEQ